jgi:hypothetical protein
MKDKLAALAQRAKDTATEAARQTTQFVQAHAPTEEDLAHARARVLAAGRAASAAAAELRKDMAQSKTFQDGAKGAAVGAVVAIPVPVVGPIIGAAIGAGVGVYLGRKPGHGTGGSSPQAQPKDLHDELLKLDALRQKGLLTDSEFEAQKAKLLKST